MDSGEGAVKKNEGVLSFSPANEAGISDTRNTDRKGVISRARAILPYLPRGPKFATDERASRKKKHT